MSVLTVFKKQKKHDGPIDVLQHGGVETAIWLNKSRNGKIHYRISWSRQVTVGKGQVKYAKSVRPEDLPAMFDSLRDTMLHFLCQGHIKLSLAEELAKYHRVMCGFDKKPNHTNGVDQN